MNKKTREAEIKDALAKIKRGNKEHKHGKTKRITSVMELTRPKKL